jgi:hypothetical protein
VSTVGREFEGRVPGGGRPEGYIGIQMAEGPIACEVAATILSIMLRSRRVSYIQAHLSNIALVEESTESGSSSNAYVKHNLS